MKKFILSLALIALPLLGLATEEEFVVDRGEGKIHGTLLVPDDEQPAPVVVLIAGSGPTDRDGNQSIMPCNNLKYIAEALYEEGFASYRFDKRCIGASAEGFDPNGVVLQDFSGDVVALVERLTGDGRFSEIILAGHSEGASIALLAAEGNDNVDKVILLAGAGRRFDDIVMEQLSGQINAGLPLSVLEDARRVFDQLREGNTGVEYPPMLAALFHEGVQPFLVSTIQYDPLAAIASMEVPVMIIQGDMDLQISVIDADALSSAQPAARKVIIHDMNHVLKRCESMNLQVQMQTYTDPNLPLHEELMPAIMDFLRS